MKSQFICCTLFSLITCIPSAYAKSGTHVPNPSGMKINVSIYAVVPPSGYKYCDATAKMSAICNGQEKCQVYVNDAICGDPSPGILKHLTTTYACGTHSYVNDTAEYSTAVLDCTNPGGHGAIQVN